jgi:hypothetical protein
MNAGADVGSFDALHDWYAALAEFRTEAQAALTSLALALQRAADWLEQQQSHWRRQIRVGEEEVVQARAELTSRRFAGFDGEEPDCSTQEDNLHRAEARLEFAQDRLEATRRWLRRLPQDREDTYEGPARRLAFFLDADLARGLAVLQRQLAALERYADLRSAAPPDKETP